MGSETDILDMERRWTVQQAAEQSGFSVHTLRYYERVGLLDPPERGETSGHRRYSEADLQRVEFLKRLRTTGMPIREMQNFIALYRQGDTTLPERIRLLSEHRCRVLNQVTELEECLGAIEWKITSYNRLSADLNGSEQGICNNEH